MQAKYRITETDYVNAGKLHARWTPKLVAIFSIGAICLVLLAFFGSPRVTGNALGGLAGGVIVVVIGRHIISPMILRKNYSKYKAIHDEFSIELIENGIRFISPSGDGKLIWDKILKWRQDENYILVYPMPRLYYMIPKSIEVSGFNVSSLASQLTQHVGKPV